ncbi:fluoride efflux transporter FluC [Actinacidiphila rubida]|uniref:Fluoride-specific ion channel FluC n=1 Tax=Actinacidiphila rubida TaxID=310780 RepID=A0A1H8JH42_9ACTN|nr:CrcB family protein [Actinacidiphila rubida]SEN79547.1 CrcB protein [Actinacidiphila rubida]
MTGPDWGWLALGAAVASPVRYWAGVLAKSSGARPFPAGTFAVNMAASLLLGIALEMRLPQAWIQSLLATGFCGALSTWSTLAWETTGFVRARMTLLAAAYLAASVAAGVLLAWAGTAVGRQVWG